MVSVSDFPSAVDLESLKPKPLVPSCGHTEQHTQLWVAIPSCLWACQEGISRPQGPPGQGQTHHTPTHSFHQP